ncbi:hypothetical protein EIP91_006818 [Steccherinum ochraceum]|uniref:Uncharacterized protein n=1 Tax=Steccherinum ochraceum TaxID=92696 RepID=A0A4R0R509_9APHY|nr:hypothetical protein EIP91_006818 [Steccherinum ochraceum]
MSRRSSIRTHEPVPKSSSIITVDKGPAEQYKLDPEKFGIASNSPLLDTLISSLTVEGRPPSIKSIMEALPRAVRQVDEMYASGEMSLQNWRALKGYDITTRRTSKVSANVAPLQSRVDSGLPLAKKKQNVEAAEKTVRVPTAQSMSQVAAKPAVIKPEDVQIARLRKTAGELQKTAVEHRKRVSGLLEQLSEFSDGK